MQDDAMVSPPSAIVSHVGILAAALLFFQVYLPIGAMPLNVNAADPIAVVALVAVLVGAGIKWRHPHVIKVVIACTVVMTIGLFVGIWHVGFTKWAFVNKYFGWFLLLGFGAAGALAARYNPQRAIQVFIYTFCAIGTFAIGRQGLMNLGALEFAPMTGAAQNQNAFAFQALMVLCAILSRNVRHETYLAIIPVTCCVLCGGRSAIGTTAVVFIVVIAFIPKSFLRIATIFAGSALLFGLIYSLSYVPGLLAPVSASHGGAASGAAVTLSTQNLGVPFAGDYAQSNSEHAATIISGLKMFSNHPIFGNGLGSFAAEWKGASTAQVVHSTSVWLLAEFGLVGGVVFGLPIILLFWREAKCYRANDQNGHLIVLTIAAFSAMSLLHELLYQRTLWFLLGFALVANGSLVSKPARSSEKVQPATSL